MLRVPLTWLLLLCLQLLSNQAAEVFVIADTNNQTPLIADVAKESIAEANDFLAQNTTIEDPDVEQDAVVRKKRTFGDIVFRGLADVLGYNIARKPPETAFPPPLAPVPGIDAPIQAAPAPVPAPPPCGAPRAAAPPPCRAQAPPPPPPPPPPPKPAPPPCQKPRAAPRPKPRPKPRPPPPPPPPPPCAMPRANPTTPSPCAPPPPPPPPPKADNLETISSNFRLNFNFNRVPAAPPAPLAAEAIIEEEPQDLEDEQGFPVAIEPRAAKLPLAEERHPRVYVDAFVVRNGVTQKVHAVDARNINQEQVAEDDYLNYDDEQQQADQQDDDYEDTQESRDRAKAVRKFGTAVDRFWEQKQKAKKKLPADDYRNVHFGDRDLANQIRRQDEDSHQPLQRKRARPNRIPLPLPQTEAEEEAEITTTTQDPRRRLKPRILPPTEQNPNEIDTVTVRVPPIYKEKRPKKLHRERPERPDRDEDDYTPTDYYSSAEDSDSDSDSDSESENSALVSRTEPPKRKRRRKQKSRKVRSAAEPYTAGDYDYYGKKLPSSDEEEFYKSLTIPPPTQDADVARLEAAEDKYFLDDHERLTEDKERLREEIPDEEDERNDDNDHSDESERADENERADEQERAGENERSDERERTDKLSPNARVRESGYQNNYVHATNVQVDDPNPLVATVKKKTKISKP